MCIVPQKTIQAHPCDFRANVSNGASIEKVDLNDFTVDLAKRAASALDLTFAGVDITLEPFPKVIEVNTNLGFSKKSIKVTGVDIAQVMADCIENKFSQPD